MKICNNVYLLLQKLVLPIDVLLNLGNCFHSVPQCKTF
jgi:hypothetical protein